MRSTAVGSELRISAGEKMRSLKDIPYLCSEMSCERAVKYRAKRGFATYHTTHIPNVNAVRPWLLENDLWCSVHVRLNVLEVYFIAKHCRPKIAQNRSAPFLGQTKLSRSVYDSAVSILLPGRRAVELCFFKVGENAVVPYPKHDVACLDIYWGDRIST